jgi:hypothetical protein
MVGSGNGTLDFILLTESAGGSQNNAGAFNGDNANTQMPTGSGNTTANESFITSIGELRQFFILNFPNGSGGSTVNQLVVMVDVNETGGPQSINLDKFDIVRNFAAFAGSDPRNDPLNNDITSAQQNATNASYSGGTLLANLDASPKVAWTGFRRCRPCRSGDLHRDSIPFDPTYRKSDIASCFTGKVPTTTNGR